MFKHRWVWCHSLPALSRWHFFPASSLHLSATVMLLLKHMCCEDGSCEGLRQYTLRKGHLVAQRTSKIHHLASKQDGALIHTMRVNLRSSTLREWETDITVCTPLCAVLSQTGGNSRDHTQAAEKRGDKT